MNKIIEKQLNNLQIATHNGYDEDKHQFIFKKITGIKLNINSCYLIKLNKTLLEESLNDSLMYNLNRGTFPTHEYMLVDVLKLNQGLVQINGVYYDTLKNETIKEFWSGWLPINQIEVIREEN